MVCALSLGFAPVEEGSGGYRRSVLVSAAVVSL